MSDQEYYSDEEEPFSYNQDEEYQDEQQDLHNEEQELSVQLFDSEIQPIQKNQKFIFDRFLFGQSQNLYLNNYLKKVEKHEEKKYQSKIQQKPKYSKKDNEGMIINDPDLQQALRLQPKKGKQIYNIICSFQGKLNDQIALNYAQVGKKYFELLFNEIIYLQTMEQDRKFTLQLYFLMRSQVLCQFIINKFLSINNVTHLSQKSVEHLKKLLIINCGKKYSQKKINHFESEIKGFIADYIIYYQKKQQLKKEIEIIQKNYFIQESTQTDIQNQIKMQMKRNLTMSSNGYNQAQCYYQNSRSGIENGESSYTTQQINEYFYNNFSQNMYENSLQYQQDQNEIWYQRWKQICKRATINQKKNTYLRNINQDYNNNNIEVKYDDQSFLVQQLQQNKIRNIKNNNLDLDSQNQTTLFTDQMAVQRNQCMKKIDKVQKVQHRNQNRSQYANQNKQDSYANKSSSSFLSFSKSSLNSQNNLSCNQNNQNLMNFNKKGQKRKKGEKINLFNNQISSICHENNNVLNNDSDLSLSVQLNSFYKKKTDSKLTSDTKRQQKGRIDKGQHADQIEKYLSSVYSIKSQINLLSQQMEIPFVVYHRAQENKKFIVTGQLKFKCPYLNNKEVQYRAVSQNLNLNKAKAECAKQILMKMYCQIPELWKDFVQKKKVKGILV